MKKPRIQIQVLLPRENRRAVELFADNRFKPRVVLSKRVYTRKPNNAGQPD